MKFSIRDFCSKCEGTADLVTFPGEILNGKLHFLYRVYFWYPSISSSITIQETISVLANFHSVMLHIMLYTLYKRFCDTEIRLYNISYLMKAFRLFVLIPSGGSL